MDHEYGAFSAVTKAGRHGTTVGTDTTTDTTIEEEVILTTAKGHTQAIRATAVVGTDVRDMAGNTIGTVEDVMLDKLSNNIMFAVVGFGGLLGMGEKYHPLPWSLLTYDEEKGAYVVDLTEDQLRRAPADSIDALTRNDGANFRQSSYEYFGVTPDWT